MADVKEEKVKDSHGESGDGEESPEVDYKPVIQLPLVEIPSLEEDEKELLVMRARLYRYDTADETPSWKERGTGEVKILLKEETSKTRLIMRRDKTLKICANHYITSSMELKNHGDNERAFMWSTLADFADETAKAELLCIRFKNVENAQKFKEAFEEAKEHAKKYEEKTLLLDENELNTKLDNVHLSNTCDNDETKEKQGDDDEDEEEEDDDDDEEEEEEEEVEKGEK